MPWVVQRCHPRHSPQRCRLSANQVADLRRSSRCGCGRRRLMVNSAAVCFRVKHGRWPSISMAGHRRCFQECPGAVAGWRRDSYSLRYFLWRNLVTRSNSHWKSLNFRPGTSDTPFAVIRKLARGREPNLLFLYGSIGALSQVALQVLKHGRPDNRRFISFRPLQCAGPRD